VLRSGIVLALSGYGLENCRFGCLFRSLLIGSEGRASRIRDGGGYNSDQQGEGLRHRFSWEYG
jgi:hypothetical protein